MIGSFFSGLSGLQSNQTKLEVIGSNIANTNTIGFKAARVEFSDILARTVQSATQAGAPIQIGRGTQVAAITTLHTQGGLQDSSVDTDFAIQGRGFFIVSDGAQERYTRAGNFLVSEDNRLVTQDGLSVQGFNAVNGQIPVTAVPEALRFPTEPLAARATSIVTLEGNLSAATRGFALDADGNVARIGGADGVIGIEIAGTVSVTDDGTTISVAGSGTDFNALTAGDTIIIDGRIYTIDAIADETNLTLTRPAISGTLEVAAGSSIVVGTGTQFTADLFVGDTLNIDGSDVTITSIVSDTQLQVSGSATNEVAAGSTLEFGQAAGIRAASGETVEIPTAPPATTELASLTRNVAISRLETANILVQDRDTGAQLVVSLKGTDTLGDLELAVRNAGFTEFAINSDRFGLSKLDANNGTATSIQVVDSLGNAHLGILTAFRTDEPNTWTWRMDFPSAADIPQDVALELSTNAQGIMRFDSNGALQSFQNMDGAEQFTLGVVLGDATAVGIQMDHETMQGVTQYNLPSDLMVDLNNGSLPGTFQSFTLDTNGVITGNFSNGESQVLGQVLLADFTNSQGLARQGSNLFASTVNSGGALIGAPGRGNFGLTVSGAVELSNVDLAEQFIEMILAQRGLQSAANVITTGDQIMNDLLALKR